MVYDLYGFKIFFQKKMEISRKTSKTFPLSYFLSMPPRSLSSEQSIDLSTQKSTLSTLESTNLSSSKNAECLTSVGCFQKTEPWKLRRAKLKSHSEFVSWSSSQTLRKEPSHLTWTSSWFGLSFYSTAIAGSTVVVYSTNDSKVEGSNPAPGTGIEIMAK